MMLQMIFQREASKKVVDSSRKVVMELVVGVVEERWWGRGGGGGLGPCNPSRGRERGGRLLMLQVTSSMISTLHDVFISTSYQFTAAHF